jgi:hypothetical protein
MTMLLLIPVIGRAFVERWPSFLLVSGTLCGLFVVLVINDMRDYARKEMDGLAEAAAAAPPGQTIATLWYPTARLGHYSDQPLLYISHYYLLMRGGYVPNNMGIHPGMPFRDAGVNKAPVVFNAWDFVWATHGAQFDGFLVRPLPNRPDSPFDHAGRKGVRLVKEAGYWRYYARIGAGVDAVPPDAKRKNPVGKIPARHGP